MMKNNDSLQNREERVTNTSPMRRRRGRAKRYYRCREGVKNLPTWKFIPVVMLLVIGITAWIAAGDYIPKIATHPVFELISASIVSIANSTEYITSAAVSMFLIVAVIYTARVLLVTLFFGVITRYIAWCGKPRGADEIEEDLAAAFGLTARINAFKHPFMISRKRLKGGVYRWEFYSRWIPLKVWVHCQDAVEHALDCRLVEPIQYGKKRRNIVIVAAHGAKQTDRGELHDDEL